MQRRPKNKFSTAMAVFIVGWVFAVATGLPTIGADVLPVVEGIFVLCGLGLLLGNTYRNGGLIQAPPCPSPHALSHPSLRSQRLPSSTSFSSLGKYVLGMVFVQALLFGMSMCFFATLERMSSVNPRLIPLEPGQLIKLLKEQWLWLGWVPWALLSVMGGILACFSLKEKTQPHFSTIIIPLDRKKSWDYFWRNYFRVVTEGVIFIPILWLSILCILWGCDGLNALFGYPSLFETPLRSVSIFALLMLVFYKSHRKILNFARVRQIPLGGILTLYCLSFIFFVFWLHGVGAPLMFGIESHHSETVLKSTWLSTMSSEAFHSRLSLLIGSWWGIWIPWMASVMARCSVGKKIGHTLLLSLIFPTLMWLGFKEYITLDHWASFMEWSAKGLNQCAVGGVLGIFILVAFSNVHTREDISKGGGRLNAAGRSSKPEPLDRWVTLLIMMIACFFPGIFVLGWIPMQMINTSATIVMLTVTGGLLWRLLSSTFPSSGAVKYMPLE